MWKYSLVVFMVAMLALSPGRVLADDPIFLNCKICSLPKFPLLEKLNSKPMGMQLKAQVVGSACNAEALKAWGAKANIQQLSGVDLSDGYPVDKAGDFEYSVSYTTDNKSGLKYLSLSILDAKSGMTAQSFFPGQFTIADKAQKALSLESKNGGLGGNANTVLVVLSCLTGEKKQAAANFELP